MIWLWLYDIYSAILRFLLLPPNPSTLRRIDPNSPCPACNNGQGALRFMKLKADTGDAAGKFMVVHSCGICGCNWAELPIKVPKHPVDFGG